MIQVSTMITALGPFFVVESIFSMLPELDAQKMDSSIQRWVTEGEKLRSRELKNWRPCLEGWCVFALKETTPDKLVQKGDIGLIVPAMSRNSVTEGFSVQMEISGRLASPSQTRLSQLPSCYGIRLLFCGSHSRRKPKSTMHVQTWNSGDGTYWGWIRARCVSPCCQLDSRQTPYRSRLRAKYKFQCGLRTLLFIRTSEFLCIDRFTHGHG